MASAPLTGSLYAPYLPSTEMEIGYVDLVRTKKETFPESSDSQGTRQDILSFLAAELGPLVTGEDCVPGMWD